MKINQTQWIHNYQQSVHYKNKAISDGIHIHKEIFDNFFTELIFKNIYLISLEICWEF